MFSIWNYLSDFIGFFEALIDQCIKELSSSGEYFYDVNMKIMQWHAIQCRTPTLPLLIYLIILGPLPAIVLSIAKQHFFPG